MQSDDTRREPHVLDEPFSTLNAAILRINALDRLSALTVFTGDAPTNTLFCRPHTQEPFSGPGAPLPL